MRGLLLFHFSLFLFLSGALSAQDYFLIRKNGSDRTRRIWLDRLEYTIVTADTQYTRDRILSRNDSSIWIFRYRMEDNVFMPDSIRVALKDIIGLKKHFVANDQVYATSGWLLILGLVGTLVTASDAPESALIFVPVMAVSAVILMVGHQERHFDMNREWRFERGVYTKRRRKK